MQTILETIDTLHLIILHKNVVMNELINFPYGKAFLPYKNMEMYSIITYCQTFILIYLTAILFLVFIC